MKSKIMLFCLMLTLLMGACNKWIDVKPSDRLNDEQLFSTRDGYLTALNGVYSELTSPSLYGENMSVASLDVLANYYYMNITTHRFYNITTFNYTAEMPMTTFDNTWKKAYELIVNCNVIIDKCGESSNPLLPAAYFGIVKGEALALRAMLHLDMLRLFGPVWSEAEKDRPVIPYNTSPRPTVTALLSPEDFMKRVLDDLTAAAALLKESDPIFTSGVRHGANPAGPNDFYYRQYRLNYYAVKALLARAYLWKQDKQHALLEAQQIIAETQDPVEPLFKLGRLPLRDGDVVADYDHMFRNEVLFSLYKTNRQNVYTKFFSPDIVKELRLSINNYDNDLRKINALYDDQGDHRLAAWMSLSNSTGIYLTHIKFATSPKVPGPNMMPLIRMSEVLLMAAECSNTVEEGREYLNMLRRARFCVNLMPTTATQLKDFITREFRKEVWGEGQMFFYYKRNAMATIPNHTDLLGTGTKAMPLGNYKVPLPLSEIAVRGN